MNYVFLIGRIFFSSIFLVKSLGHFSPAMIEHATQMGVPAASILVPLSGLLAFLGGLSILLGYKVKVGSLLLILFLLPTTFMMHKFWLTDDFFANMMHQYCFFKNLSLLGAVLMISYFGTGPLSLDHKKCCK